MATITQSSGSNQLSTPQVTANDRIMFTLFLAAVLHGILILGIGFTLPPEEPSAESLEITLAHNKSQTTPEEADYLAQVNQLGSGSLEEKSIVSTTETAAYEDNVVREIDPIQQEASQKRVPQTTTKTLSSTSTSLVKTAIDSEQKRLEHAKQASAIAMLQRSLEIASLEAQLNERKQVHAKRPRKRQLTAVSTKASQDAAYLDGWRKRIERFGNLYYPPNLVNKKIFGSLRLMVAIKSDGSVHEIRVLKSSGKRVLDDAAIYIVQRSAPFATFPEEIAANTDILEIIRTWQFKKGNQLSSY